MSRRTDLHQATKSVISALYQAMRSHQLQGARPRLIEDAASTTPRPRREARESQGEEHAAFVRDLFRRYLETGSVVRLKAALDQENVRLPTRTDGRGKMTGGGLIRRGHLYKILSNPIYVGRLTHKDEVHEGLHAPIVDHESWNRVQRRLAAHAQDGAGSRHDSDALLTGKLLDDRRNRMSPSHATKRGRRFRYYVSQAILQGRKEDVGSVARVPAMELERRVVDAVRGAAPTDPRERSIETRITRSVSDRPIAINSAGAGSWPCVLDPGADLRAAVERITIRCTTLEIQLAEGMAEDSSDRILVIPWTRRCPVDAARSFREKADDPLPCTDAG